MVACVLRSKAEPACPHYSYCDVIAWQHMVEIPTADGSIPSSRCVIMCGHYGLPRLSCLMGWLTICFCVLGALCTVLFEGFNVSWKAVCTKEDKYTLHPCAPLLTSFSAWGWELKFERWTPSLSDTQPTSPLLVYIISSGCELPWVEDPYDEVQANHLGTSWSEIL